MMRQALILSVALSFGLVGCTLRPANLVGLPSTGSAPEVTGSMAPVDTTQQSPVTQYGTLQLTVKWPEQPTGYNVALLPTTTNSLIVTIKNGTTVVAQQTVARETGATSATAVISLKAANNLSIEVNAYREASPVDGVSDPIARGSGNANIVPSKKTSATLQLTPVYVPTITALSTNAGVTGDYVTITGTNFGTGSVPVQVSFNGYLSDEVTRLSETSVRAKLPPGVPTGYVVVTADGVSSTSNSWVFWVPKTLSLSVNKSYWDPTDSTRCLVILGKTKQMFASVDWEIKIGDTLGYFGASPTPSWTSTDTSAGTVDTSGLFTAGDAYAPAGTEVTASFGSKVSNSLVLVPEDVTVTLAPPPSNPPIGGKGRDFVVFKAFNTFSDGATNSFVTYSADASASVDVTGKATVTDFGSNGTIQITAASEADATRTATASVGLLNYAVSTYGGDGTEGLVDGDRLASRFKHPQGMAFDQSGNLYVADHGNGVIRRISSGGMVSTLNLGLAGFQPWGLAYYRDVTNSMDWLYATDDANHKVYRIELISGGSSGNASVLAGSGSAGYTDGAGAAAQFNSPKGIAVDANRNVYVADDNNSCVRRIDAAGMVSTFAGSPFAPSVSPFNRDGQGSDPQTGAKFVHPTGLTIDANGHMFVTQVNDGHIRHVAPNAMVDTKPMNQSLWNPMGIAVDPQGVLFVTSEDTGRVYKITPQGVVLAIAGAGGNMFIPSLQNGIGTSADLRAPDGIVRASDGSLYVTEYTNNAIRKLN